MILRPLPLIYLLPLLYKQDTDKSEKDKLEELEEEYYIRNVQRSSFEVRKRTTLVSFLSWSCQRNVLRKISSESVQYAMTIKKWHKGKQEVAWCLWFLEFSFSREKLKQLVDRTESEPHLAARNAKEMNDRWNEKSASHPWINSNLKTKSQWRRLWLGRALTFRTTVWVNKIRLARGHPSLWHIFGISTSSRPTVCRSEMAYVSQWFLRLCWREISLVKFNNVRQA